MRWLPTLPLGHVFKDNLNDHGHPSPPRHHGPGRGWWHRPHIGYQLQPWQTRPLSLSTFCCQAQATGSPILSTQGPRQTLPVTRRWHGEERGLLSQVSTSQ